MVRVGIAETRVGTCIIPTADIEVEVAGGRLKLPIISSNPPAPGDTAFLILIALPISTRLLVVARADFLAFTSSETTTTVEFAKDLIRFAGRSVVSSRCSADRVGAER